MTSRLEELRKKYDEELLLDPRPIEHAQYGVFSGRDDDRYDCFVSASHETTGKERFNPRPGYEQRREYYGGLYRFGE